MPKARKAVIERKTRETDIKIVIALGGEGKSKIDTPIGFLNHMLTLFAAHGLFDLTVEAKGDVEVDIHHTNEDIGICLGSALKSALADKAGIKRFGFASVPMDEALVEVSLDISARPYLKVSGPPSRKVSAQEYDFNALKQFLQAFVNNAGMTLHIEVLYGEDSHHIIEAIFKGLGRALKEAVAMDPRIKGILSTKGKL